jgi:hypothetical protein
MGIATGAHSLRWKVHLDASPESVYERLSSDSGRESFWVESSQDADGQVTLVFPDRSTTILGILSERPPHVLEVDYFNVHTRLTLQRIGRSTVLEVTASGIPADDLLELAAGWVSVLLNLKAVVNFGNDLRNHDHVRTWLDGFVDN